MINWITGQAKNEQGFTLIELLIALGMAAAIVTVAYCVITLTLKTLNQTEASVSTVSATNVVIYRMGNEIRAANKPDETGTRSVKVLDIISGTMGRRINIYQPDSYIAYRLVAQTDGSYNLQRGVSNDVTAVDPGTWTTELTGIKSGSYFQDEYANDPSHDADERRVIIINFIKSMGDNQNDLIINTSYMSRNRATIGTVGNLVPMVYVTDSSHAVITSKNINSSSITYNWTADIANYQSGWNTQLNWSTDSPSWISFNQTTSSKGTTSVQVTISRNRGTAARTGHITVTSVENNDGFTIITIKQSNTSSPPT